MRFPVIFVGLIFLIFFSIPNADGQILNENSIHKSIRVEIDSVGNVHVIHTIKNVQIPSNLELLQGKISDISVKDLEGMDIQYGVFDEDTIMILPNSGELEVEYDLADQLELIDNVWTWNFFYPFSTAFIFPEEVDVVFVNGNPAFLGDKPGINCHGCQMLLEYSLNEPKIIEKIQNQDEEYVFEIGTWSEIKNFNFEKESESLIFDVNDGDKFITMIIPKSFFVQPYEVFLEDDKIMVHKNAENQTHAWLNFKPQVPGEISIQGTLIPEFKEESSFDDIPIELMIVVGIGIAIGIAVVIIKKK